MEKFEVELENPPPAFLEQCLRLTPSTSDLLIAELRRGEYPRTARAFTSACTGYCQYIRIAVHYGFTDLIHAFVSPSGSRVASPCWTPSSPHRLAADDDDNAWLWLIKGDGDVDGRVWAAMEASGLVEAAPGLLRMLEGVHESGAKVTATCLTQCNSTFGRVYLHEAAAAGSLGAVKCLVEGSADVGLRDRHGNTPLHKAQGIAVAQYLLDQGADALAISGHGYTTLHTVGDVEVSRLLTRSGVDATARDHDGRTALHYAKDAAVAEHLLDCGADADAQDHDGWTALHVVKDPAVARCLVERGADPNIRDGEGCAPLHLVEDASVAQCLLEHGADPDAADDEGCTPLFYVRSLAIARVLVEGGASVDAEKGDGSTLLHELEDDEVVEYLVQCGARGRKE
jgi:ankyrin repeat protein